MSANEQPGVRQEPFRTGTLSAPFSARLIQYGVSPRIARKLSNVSGRTSADDSQGATDDATREQVEDGRDKSITLISHAIRVPATIVKGYADTMANHWDSLGEDGRKEAVRRISEHAGALSRLVDRLLFAIVDRPADGIPSAPFDLVDALREAVDELAGDLRQRVLLTIPQMELPKALGERESIAVVLLELLQNAGWHSSAEEVIEVAAGADESTVLFQVRDRGSGVDAESALFASGRYWQGAPDGGTYNKGRHPEAGLGLHLIARMLERQSGSYSLTPREGGGTVAEVRLPRSS